MAKKPEETPTPAPSPAPPALPKRWSARRKQEIVLRLLRGEPPDRVSRETEVPSHDLETWQRRYPEAGYDLNTVSRSRQRDRADESADGGGRPSAVAAHFVLDIPRATKIQTSPFPTDAPLLLGRNSAHSRAMQRS